MFGPEDFRLQTVGVSSCGRATTRRRVRELHRLACADELKHDVIGSRDGYRYPSRDRRSLEDRIAPGSSPVSRASCATSASPRTSRRMLSSPRSSSGRSRASRTTPAPGSWPPPSIVPSIIFRRNTRLERKHEELGRELEAQEMAVPDLDAALDDDIGDDLLRLMFIACHPVLPTEARVALTLRLLGGLTTAGDRARLPRSRADRRAAHRPRQAHPRRASASPSRSRAGPSAPPVCRRCSRSSI